MIYNSVIFLYNKNSPRELQQLKLFIFQLHSLKLFISIAVRGMIDAFKK